MKIWNILALIIAILFSACSSNDTSCDGEIILVNEIEDVNLIVGDPPYTRDLFNVPAVFSHSGDLTLDISNVRTNNRESVLHALAEENEQTSQTSVLVLIPVKAGTATVTVTANAKVCDNHELETSFEVRVLE